MLMHACCSSVSCLNTQNSYACHEREREKGEEIGRGDRMSTRHGLPCWGKREKVCVAGRGSSHAYAKTQAKTRQRVQAVSACSKLETEPRWPSVCSTAPCTLFGGATDHSPRMPVTTMSTSRMMRNPTPPSIQPSPCMEVRLPVKAA